MAHVENARKDAPVLTAWSMFHAAASAVMHNKPIQLLPMTDQFRQLYEIYHLVMEW